MYFESNFHFKYDRMYRYGFVTGKEKLVDLIARMNFAIKSTNTNLQRNFRILKYKFLFLPYNFRW